MGSDSRNRGIAASATRLASALALAVAGLLVLAFSAPAEAGARPSGARLDIQLERTKPIVRHEYRSLPRIGRRGAVGANRGSGGFRLSHQMLGDRWVRAGLIRRKPRLIRRGFRAFDYAFRRQASDGTWGYRQVEEYAFFVEAVAHSGLLVRASRYAGRFRGKLHSYARRTRRASSYMVASGPYGEFAYRNRSYTHSGYVVGTALTLAARFTGRSRLRRHGQRAVKLALSRGRGNGVNPELGGYDVRYQMAGISYAQRYRVYFPRGRLARRVDRMTIRGIRWMQRRVARNGYIRWRGSSRACRELSSDGEPKTPGYHYAIRGFAYWGKLKRRPGLIRKARHMDRYSRRFGGRALCGKKRQVRSGRDGDRKRRRDRGGRGDGDGLGGLLDETLPAARTSDLLE